MSAALFSSVVLLEGVSVERADGLSLILLACKFIMCLVQRR